MVLDQDLVDAATFGDVELVADWLQSLDRNEDINEVDARGRTVLNLCAKGYDNHYNDDGDGPSVRKAHGDGLPLNQCEPSLQ